MNHTQEEVMQFVKEQDVRFVKLSFCDIFGDLRNINISSKELERAFNSGISFDASAIKGFLNIDESDLFLFPDASTLSVLPGVQARKGRPLVLRHPSSRRFVV